MHEMSIVQSLADGVRLHLPPDATLIRAVVEVGSLEHLDAEVMQTAWRAVSVDPALHGSRLDIELVPIRIRCRACAGEYEPVVQAYLACPACGESRPEVLEGWGITLKTLEADVPAEVMT